jgi:hypothetical protein
MKRKTKPRITLARSVALTIATTDALTVGEDGGSWFVERNGKRIAGPFPDNREAWRALDRIAGEPVSRKEATAQWIFDKESNR